jgi:hypothetical protein
MSPDFAESLALYRSELLDRTIPFRLAHGISMIFASAFGEVGRFLGDRAITDAARIRQALETIR